MFIVTKMKDLTVLDVDVDEYINIVKSVRHLHKCIGGADGLGCTKDTCFFVKELINQGGIDLIRDGRSDDHLFDKYGVDTKGLTINLVSAKFLMDEVTKESPSSMEIVFEGPPIAVRPKMEKNQC